MKLHVEGWFLPEPFIHTAKTARALQTDTYDAGDTEPSKVQAQRIVEYADEVPDEAIVDMDSGRKHFTLRLNVRKGKRPQVIVIFLATETGEISVQTFRTEHATETWLETHVQTTDVAYYAFRWNELEYCRMKYE